MLYLDPVALGIQSTYRDKFQEKQFINGGSEGYLWTSKDGRKTPVTKMTTPHLENSIKAIRRGAIGFHTAYLRKKVLACLQYELDKRDELPF